MEVAELLKITKTGIEYIMDQYKPDSDQWALLVEARRLTEAELFVIRCVEEEDRKALAALAGQKDVEDVVT